MAVGLVRLRAALCFGVLACGRPNPATHGVASVSPSPALASAAVPPPLNADAAHFEGCPEPHTIALLDAALAPAALAADPVGKHPWLEAPCCESDDLNTLRVGNRMFAQIGDENTLVVKQEGRELWRSSFGFVPGGFIGFSVSPTGALVRRDYSRGGVELFAADSGRRLADAGRGVDVAPDESFAVDPPDFEGSIMAFNRAEVLKHTFSPKLLHKTIARWPIPVHRELERDDLHPSSFGVTICADSSLYALSFPTTELAVYRSADDTKVATYAKPGPGVPHFSKTGRLIVLEWNLGEKPSVFRLNP